MNGWMILWIWMYFYWIVQRVTRLRDCEVGCGSGEEEKG